MTSGPQFLEAQAFAKINLRLEVLNRRGDGYHEIRSLAVGIGWADTVTCRLTQTPGIEVECDAPGLASSVNLAARAAWRLAEAFGVEPSLCVSVRKGIPIAAGLGGGSSDAATTLRLCNQLWGLCQPVQRLMELGAAVGSDVPLFFHLPAVVMSGRGEVVRPVTLRWSGYAVMLSTGVEVSTAAVYGQWRPAERGHSTNNNSSESDAIASLLEARSATAMARNLGNDLTPLVLRTSPRVAAVYEHVRAIGFPEVQVSGAGSVLFILRDGLDEAVEAGDRIQAAGVGVDVRIVPVPAGS